MKILVAAASKHGSTWEMAHVIGETLGARGVDVDVAHIEDVQDVTKYDGFVLGSAVYAGRWLNQACAFMTDHAADLAGHPVWLFSSGPVGLPLVPRESKAVDIRQIAEQVRIKGHRLFAGRLAYGNLRMAEKLITRILRVPYGGYRNESEVRAWASSVANSLTHFATRRKLVARGF